ncbi:hypothetical protein PIB30_096305 [Stylosanthes scabra]|uniref:Uncharacterized protein n=1 Tax=Stylosanthes scabra TaxID=79078 RepID=A0ABU6TZ20_9FABA|nr:hypothetical protein [Stylosanthes scabra]
MALRTDGKAVGRPSVIMKIISRQTAPRRLNNTDGQAVGNYRRLSHRPSRPLFWINETPRFAGVGDIITDGQAVGKNKKNYKNASDLLLPHSAGWLLQLSLSLKNRRHHHFRPHFLPPQTSIRSSASAIVDKGSLPPLLLLPWWVWIVRCCADSALPIFPDTD